MEEIKVVNEQWMKKEAKFHVNFVMKSVTTKLKLLEN